MIDDGVDLQLYSVLLRLTRVSAKLNKPGDDLVGLLSERTCLVREAGEHGLVISGEVQQRVCDRLRQ